MADVRARQTVDWRPMRLAALKDPSGLFSAHLKGVRRAIDLYEDDHLDEAAFRELIQGAVALNLKSRPGRG